MALSQGWCVSGRWTWWCVEAAVTLVHRLSSRAPLIPRYVARCYCVQDFGVIQHTARW